MGRRQTHLWLLVELDVMGPTQKLTERSDAVLKRAGVDDEAVVAMRVRRVAGDLNNERYRFWLCNLLGWFPIVGIAAERGINKLLGDSGNNEAVLVLTKSKGRYLLSLGGFSRSHPNELIHTYSHGAPLMPDVELEAKFFSQVMVDGHRCIVNSIDFKYLAKLIFEGEIDAPQMSVSLGDYRRAMNYVSQEDPAKVLDGLGGTYGPRR